MHRRERSAATAAGAAAAAPLDARGTMSQVRVYKDVPFVVKWRNIEEAVRDDILVHPPPVDGANLLGTRTMRKLKQLKMKSN